MAANGQEGFQCNTYQQPPPVYSMITLSPHYHTQDDSMPMIEFVTTTDIPCHRHTSTAIVFLLNTCDSLAHLDSDKHVDNMSWLIMLVFGSCDIQQQVS